MIIFQYQRLHNQEQTNSIQKWMGQTKPVIEKYRAIKQKIHQIQEKRKVLRSKKQKVSILDPLQHYQLNRQITTLTENIEELKVQKDFLMSEIYCTNESDIKSVETTMKQQASLLEKLAEQHQSLSQQLEDNRQKFIKLKTSVSPKKSKELVDARMSFRNISHNRNLSKLRDVYGRNFDHNRFNDATCYIDKYIQESHTFIYKYLTQQTYEQSYKQNQPEKVQKKSQDLER